MLKLGTIKEIWRYPVKGMAGELLQQCSISASGIDGDRVWAIRDNLRLEIQSCKFRPDLLRCTARSRQPHTSRDIDIVFPDGATVGSDDATIHHRLSELLGHGSTLEYLRPAEDSDFYRRYKRDANSWLEELKATFTREPGEALPDFSQMPAQARDFVTVPGTFFLVTPFHIITTASMAHMKKLLPEADWDIRRFRPNILIETAGELTGLAEQSWIGRQIVISDTRIDCTATAPRCGAVTRQQDGLPFDKTMLRKIVTQADQNLGIYGSICQQGSFSVGDAVYLN